MSPLRSELSPRRVATRRLFLRLTGTVLGVGAAAAVDARYIEPNAVEVTHHNVFLPYLPAELEGTTVLQLTDLHRGPNTPDATIRQAIDAAVSVNPDLVVLTGDFVHRDPKDAIPLQEMLKALKPRLGVWGCLGNHDYHGSADKVVDHLTKEGCVQMLRNANHRLAPGLWIAGIEDTVKGHPDTVKALDGIPDDAAAIFLTHNPVGVWSCSDKPHLVLSGHTHGGQIRIPGMTPRLPPGMTGFPLVAGWGGEAVCEPGSWNEHVSDASSMPARSCSFYASAGRSSPVFPADRRGTCGRKGGATFAHGGTSNMTGKKYPAW